MGCFPAKLEVSAWLEIEVRAGGRELSNARRSFFDENFYCLRIAERRACCQGILTVKLRRVSGAQRRRNSTLRVGCGAIEERPLGEDHHVAVGGSAPRSVKTSNPASHHQKARPYSLGHE